MKILALCSYPTDAAATRFRIAQFVEPLADRGIDVTIRPFLDSGQFSSLYSGGGVGGKAFSLVRSVLKRVGELVGLRKYDLIFVQREAMLFGPAIFEWLYQAIGRVPMVLDLDDATYVSYISPSYGRLGSALKFFGKTDRLIEWAAVVTCGNRFIAEYVEGKGTRAVVISTVVDNSLFCPADHKNELPVIGWIGTHSTYQFLTRLFPVIERLAEKHRFRLVVVGAGDRTIEIPGVQVESRQWQLDREIVDFQSIDIGVYPIFPGGSANAEWIKGKSGFKAIQYMAVGIPFVMSPVGVCAEIGETGKTHLNAESDDDWYNSLDTLLGDGELRRELGAAGRQHAIANYDLEAQAEKLAGVFRDVLN